MLPQPEAPREAGGRRDDGSRGRGEGPPFGACSLSTRTLTRESQAPPPPGISPACEGGARHVERRADSRKAATPLSQRSCTPAPSLYVNSGDPAAWAYSSAADVRSSCGTWTEEKGESAGATGGSAWRAGGAPAARQVRGERQGWRKGAQGERACSAACGRPRGRARVGCMWARGWWVAGRAAQSELHGLSAVPYAQVHRPVSTGSWPGVGGQRHTAFLPALGILKWRNLFLRRKFADSSMPAGFRSP